MGKGRLEAFSDGVIAVLITIMVLEMKVPHGTDLRAIEAVVPIFLTYILSYIFIGIYWNNHHHLLYTVTRIDGRIMWANLHLLFWLSLVPFVTGWMGETISRRSRRRSTASYFIMAAFAYTILQSAIVSANGEHSTLANAVGNDLKGKICLLCYLAAIAAAFFNRWLADVLYVVVAMIWLVPDRRIEKSVAK